MHHYYELRNVVCVSVCVLYMLTFAHVGSFLRLQAVDDPLCIDVPTLALWV